MARVLLAVVLMVGLTVLHTDVESSQNDAFLPIFINTGTIYCREYRTANGARLSTYQWWLMGFISGAGHMNRNAKRPMASISTSGALEWTGKYCQENPGNTLAAAAVRLVDILSNQMVAP